MVRSDDPGLQVERTTLAWIRTSMAFAVVSLLLIRTGRPETILVAVVLALTGVATAIGLSLVQRNRHRGRVSDFNAAAPVHGVRAVAAGTALTLLLTAAALGCVWL